MYELCVQIVKQTLSFSGLTTLTMYFVRVTLGERPLTTRMFNGLCFPSYAE